LKNINNSSAQSVKIRCQNCTDLGQLCPITRLRGIYF
jgi:hypothetical protein